MKFARWPVEPLRRPRRGLDERIIVAVPRLARVMGTVVLRDRARSPLRRALLTYVLRVGIAANNRNDYEVLRVYLDPEIEMHALPDDPGARPGDLDAVYHGPDGYIALNELWKAPFGEFRWDLLELVDPGGDRIGGRTEMIGRGGGSGAEVHLAQFYVWQFERGLLRRQWSLNSEAAMLEVLAAE